MLITRSNEAEAKITSTTYQRPVFSLLGTIPCQRPSESLAPTKKYARAPCLSPKSIAQDLDYMPITQSGLIKVGVASSSPLLDISSERMDSGQTGFRRQLCDSAYVCFARKMACDTFSQTTTWGSRN